jgi:hypothetical protein
MRIHTIPAIVATVMSMFATTGVASARVLDAEVYEGVIPDYVSILDVTYGGSGCPDSTMAASFSPDYQALTLIFDSYLAEVGPDVEFPKKRLFCHLVLKLGFPAGYSYALVDLTYQGYADLEFGINAAQSSSYYFQGFQKDDKYSFKTSVYGPFIGDYWRTDALGLVSWSPCDKIRNLNIVTSLNIDNNRHRKGYGSITLDSIDNQVIEKYGVRWRRCPVI